MKTSIQYKGFFGVQFLIKTFSPYAIFSLFLIYLVSFPASAQNLESGRTASLAIDQRDGDQYGWAIQYDSQSEADERALQECEKNGGDSCQVVLRFIGGCGAYVVERGNGSLYGWGTAETRGAAESRAMSEARAVGGKDLVTRVWGCNGGKLTHSEEVTGTLKGVYFYHFTYSEDENRCFVTNVLYQPALALKQGNSWVWSGNAEKVMTPLKEKYLDVVEENLYGYLGDMMEHAFTRVLPVDWAGKNEVDHNTAALDLSNSERKEMMEGAIQHADNMCRDAGAEIVRVDVGI